MVNTSPPAYSWYRPTRLPGHGDAASADGADFLLDPPPGYEVLALDRPGFGRSRPAHALPRLDEQARAVAALLPADGRGAVLLGHSLGGAIAARVAAEQPHAVRALVLVSTTDGAMILDDDIPTIGAPRDYLQWITATRGSAVRLITVAQICYFQADSKYTRVACEDSDALITLSLRDLLDRLDPTMFWQIHRSTIVNAGAIDSVSRDGSGHVSVRLKSRPETLRVSQGFAHRFRQM